MKKSKLLILSLSSLLVMASCGKDKESESQQPSTIPSNTESESQQPSEPSSSPTQEESSSVVEDNSIAKQAGEVLRELYKNDKTQTKDFKVVTKIMVDADVTTVSWDIEYKGDNKTAITKGAVEGVYQLFTVNYASNFASDCEYTLIATLTDANGKTFEVRFDQTVPMFVTTSYEDWIATCKKNGSSGTETATIKGYIINWVRIDSGSSSKGSMYIQDAEGHGYYAYAPKFSNNETASQEAFEKAYPIGAEVIVSGSAIQYSGQYEFGKNCTVTPTGRTAKDAGVDLPYTNGTEDFSKAKNNKDATTLDVYQNARITLEGCKLGRNDDKYYYFTIGDQDVEYNLYNTNYFLKSDDLTTLMAKWEGGATATITGVVNCYSNTFQIYPDSVDSITITQKASSEGKANALFDSFTLDASINKNIDLPTAEGLVWSVIEGSEAATVKDNVLTITRLENDTNIKLKGTYTFSADEVYTREYTTIVEAAEKTKYIAKKLTEAKEGTFKFVMDQNKLGKTLYFDGTLSTSEYLNTTENVSKATDVTVAKVEAGYTFKVGEKYLELYTNSSDKVRPTLVDAATGAWVWNADAKVFTWTIADAEYYLGSYNTFNTMSASKISYITGSNAGNVGVSQFPASMASLVEADYKKFALTEAKEGTFKFAMDQNKLGQTLYFDGTLSTSEYLNTTENLEKATDVTVAKVEAGYTFKVGEKYLELYTNSSDKVRPTLVDAATGAWVWNADAKVFTWTIADAEYYLGSYNTFNTMSASKISYITGSNAGNVGVSQFPASMVELILTEITNVVISEPTEGTFKFAMDQNKLGQTLYFDGTLSSAEFLNTTENFEKATDVTVAKVEAGYTFKVGEKYLELYTNSSDKIRPTLVDAATGAWVWNADAKVFTWTIADTEYYLGSYNTFNTMSASKISYITGSSAGNVGVSQFVCYFTIKDFVE